MRLVLLVSLIDMFLYNEWQLLFDMIILLSDASALIQKIS